MKIIHGDCLEIMRTMEDDQYDWVITDPPYGINADKGIGGGSERGEVKKFEGGWDSKTPDKEVFDEMMRVSKNQIIFGGNYFTDKLPPSSGWIIWDKRCGKMPERTFADGEMAWTSLKKPMRIFRFVWDGMIQSNMKFKEKRVHPTQKPLEVMKWIIEKYTQSDETILDPFLGSGSTIIAAESLDRKCDGIEISKEFCDIAKERLGKLQMRLV